MRTAVIINPISGTHGNPESVRHRVQLAHNLLSSAGIEHQVFITEHVGHAYALARQERDRATPLVLAWGGDGTMNEVARALAFSTTALGLIPAGSGNGLARELNIPFDPAAALKKALQGTDYRIDAGEIGGHLFFNAAGMGFDAQVSALFNSRPHGRRGFLSYIILALQALLTYQPEEYTIVTEHETLRQPFLLIALANSRQYGNGAIVAPHAQLNDGQLDLVTIRARSPLILLWEARRLFNGTITKSASVQSRHIRHATISSPQPLCLHVDGEPVANMEATLSVDLHPAALCVRM